MPKESKGSHRKLGFSTIMVGICIFLILAVGEITVRIMGYGPWDPPKRATSLEPPGQFFMQDEVLGYKNRPGSFQLTLNQTLSFTANHGPDGHRKIPAPDSTNHQIWILGGSFTYGWGVDDEACFPFLVAKSLDSIRVENFGTGGYGTLQSYLQFNTSLEKGVVPGQIILAYASFHDQRNTANQYWMKAIAPHAVLEDLSFPHARLVGDSLVLGKSEVAYSALPGSKWSALMNFWDEFLCRKDEGSLNSRETTKHIIHLLQKECIRNNIKLRVVGISNDERTQTMLSELNAQFGIQVRDISVDLGEPGMSLEPVDPHPSALAHQEFARALLQMLKADQ